MAVVGFGCPYTLEVELTAKPIIRAPTVWAGPGAVPAAADLVDTHTGWWMISQNHMSPVDSSWEGIHSGSFPNRSTVVLPTSHHSLEVDLGASTSKTGEQTLPPIRL